MTRVPIGLGVAHQLTAALTLSLAVDYTAYVNRGLEKELDDGGSEMTTGSDRPA